ncbi:MAG: hypothetical protein WCG27_00075, partial [Pseudomonadota bacterium]
MKKLYAKFTAKQFRLISSFFSVLGDLSICYYIYFNFSTFLKSSKWTDAMDMALKMQSPNLQTGQLDPQVLEQMHQIMMMTLQGMLVLAIVFHLVIYTLYYFNKPFVFWYLKVVAWGGIVFCLWIGISAFSMTWIAPYLLFQAVLYFFNIWGMRYFPFV